MKRLSPLKANVGSMDPMEGVHYYYNTAPYSGEAASGLHLTADQLRSGSILGASCSKAATF